MLKEKIIDKALNTEDSIETDRSRCLRMRFNQNSCARCVEQCRFNAITISEDVHIKAGKCSECMLCVSSCPSDCFDINRLDFYSIIGKLRKVQSSVGSSVLGCRANTKTPSHEKTYCFGFLSEEHIIALSAFMNGQLQIDLSGCADCRNGFIVDTVEKRISDIEAKTSLRVSEKIKLIKNKTGLHFQEISYDRRGFFKAIKNLTFLKTAELFDNNAEDMDMQSYSSKQLPLKKELLNRTLNVLSEEPKKEVLKTYYYTVTANESCNNCFACVGMCPTGALNIEKAGHGRELFFNSSLCIGCGLCESFCINNSFCIVKGFSGDNPFEFGSAKMDGNVQIRPENLREAYRNGKLLWMPWTKGRR